MTGWLISLVEQLHPSLAQLSGIPLWVFVTVVALTLAFFVVYLIKGTQVGWQLWSASHRLNKLRMMHKVVSPDNAGKILSAEPFRHLWAEYNDTLHGLKRTANGSVEVRATVPAETFFTQDVLVDGRLLDDFMRHLPGILTGLGIIGTFAGLLDGLQKFDPSSTTAAVAGLKPLLDGVAHAFIASATAIGCAMIITFVSRLALAYFYRLVERLNHSIDALYSTGAGEEYLARLVHSSEKNEAHAAQLKDALVEDLNKLMTNLVERQMEANAQVTQLLGDRIGQSIHESLRAPMDAMTDVLQQTRKANGEALHGMLETMLTGFMAKLQDTFGGQMRGANDQMERSINAMMNVQLSLQQLLSDVAKTNEQATTHMSGKLEDAMKQAAANQSLMTDQMREFVQEFRSLVTEEQDRSKKVMDATVAHTLQQVSEAMVHLETTRRNAATQEQVRGERMSAHTTDLVSGLSGQVEALIESVAEQVALTQRNIDAISNVSTRAIDGMNQGALTMGTAASRFETAGTSVSTVFERSDKVAEQLTSSANVLQAAAVAVRQGFDQYENTRRTVDDHVASLTALIANAKAEAGLTKEMLGDLDRIIVQLRVAEGQSQQYLEGVNGALEKAFRDFGTSLANQVAAAIKQTDTHMGNGVSHLTGVVQEIGTALARMKRPN